MKWPWESVIEGIVGIIDKAVPDKDKAKEISAAIRSQALAGAINTDLAQISVNLEEAKSDKWWKAGWRPFIGWVCGVSFAYSFAVLPFLKFIIIVQGIELAEPLPDPDLTEMMPVLLGLLGLGGLRTYEKAQGVHKK